MSIQILTSFVFLMSSIYGDPQKLPNEDIEFKNEKQDKTETTIETISFDDFIKEYYKNDPILYEIAKCESEVRHWDNKGEVLRGKVNKADVGLMQINEIYHKKTAEKLGFDLKTIEGNLSYAKWLYEKEGTMPWIHSSKCWNKTGKELVRR